MFVRVVRDVCLVVVALAGYRGMFLNIQNVHFLFAVKQTLVPTDVF